MPDIQQSEMRRSGRTPLAQDSAANKVSGKPGGGDTPGGPVPPDQESPYGPQPSRERRLDDQPEESTADGGSPDAILIGGPRDGTPFHGESTALVTIQVDGLIHRYIRTKAHRQLDDRELVVYNYDGENYPS